jgi:hypothetical protein
VVEGFAPNREGVAVAVVVEGAACVEPNRDGAAVVAGLAPNRDVAAVEAG